jgi:hypothetical protein
MNADPSATGAGRTSDPHGNERAETWQCYDADRMVLLAGLILMIALGLIGGRAALRSLRAFVRALWPH